MAEQKQDVCRVARRAASSLLPGGARLQLLLADSSGAHMREAIDECCSSGSDGCPVDTPRSCPAVRRGRALVFQDSGALDACPTLARSAACSAVCVPISVAGQTVGVLYVSQPTAICFGWSPASVGHRGDCARGLRVDEERDDGTTIERD